MSVLGVRSRNARGREPDVRRSPVDRRGRTDSGGHFARDILVHGPVCGEQFGVNAKQRVFQTGVVGHYSPTDDDGRTGHSDELGDQQSARQRLGDADGKAASSQFGNEVAGSDSIRHCAAGTSARRTFWNCHRYSKPEYTVNASAIAMTRKSNQLMPTATHCGPGSTFVTSACSGAR